MAGEHTCASGPNRNKAPVADFYGLLSGSSKYTDEDFTTDNDALWWSDLGEYPGNTNRYPTWTRAKTAFPNSTLFGDGVTVDDINQGGLGNCWFLSAASVLAQKEGRLEKVFLNTANALNNNGIYAVNFFTLGIPHTVVVDDYLPLSQGWNGGY